MKTIRLFGIALLTVLLIVSFSSCSKSDDDSSDDNTTASIEGTWYLKTETWYGWKNGQPDMSNKKFTESYGDYANERVWVIKKSGSNYIVIESRVGGEGKERTLEPQGKNEYKKGHDKVVVKTVTSTSLVVDYYDHFYQDEYESSKEYGIYTFMR